MALTRRLISWPVALWLVLYGGGTGTVRADPLNPSSFASLGTFPTSVGSYSIDTSGVPTLTGPGGMTLTGVVAGNTAVFTFDSIVIGDGLTVRASGMRPLALLSYGGVTVSGSGVLNVSGVSAVGGLAGPGGPGGGTGGQGGGSGSPGGGTGGGDLSGGGGFGGRGGNGFVAGSGGETYGDLALSLVGGSGGGGSRAVSGLGTDSGSGGGGGGGVEIGALSGISIGGNGILADGGSGGSRGAGGGPVGGGGGSGGGIFLHGDAVAISGPVSARGGPGGLGISPVSFLTRPGGGGGGGRVLILAGPGGFSDSGFIDVSGGLDGLDNPSGAPGQITVVPEPASWLLLGLGIVGLSLFAGLASARSSGGGRGKGFGCG